MGETGYKEVKKEEKDGEERKGERAKKRKRKDGGKAGLDTGSDRAGFGGLFQFGKTKKEEDEALTNDERTKVGQDAREH